jgi:hypothetical protein
MPKKKLSGEKRASAKKVVKNKAGKKKNSIGRKNDVPVLVKLISVLYWIGAVFMVLIGLVLFVGIIAGSEVFRAAVEKELIDAGEIIDPALMSYVILSIIVFSIIMVGAGIFEIFVARGLWKGKSWARIAVIVISIVSILISLVMFNLIGIVISLLIGGYIWLSKDVKAAFKR